MILYQLDKKQAVIGIVSSDILSATFEEQINTAGNLKFTTAKKLRDDCLYVLLQRPSATTYMCFKVLTETQEDNQVSYTAVESAYDELGAYSYIKDMRPQNRTAKEMLTQILAQTRYSVGYVADTGTQTTNFYYTTVLASLQSVVNLFNLEITFDVVFDPIDNQVKRRLVNLYTQMGSRTGRRYEYGDKLLSVTCEQSSDTLVTALVGRGSSVQVSEGTDGSPDGYSRKITFADVVWKKSAGNPLDKPADQEYLEDPSATAVYGFSDGKPRIGFVEFDKINDKNLLIKATYDKLQELKRPKVSFKASVTDVGSLNLGDTVAIIRHDLKIEYLTRVYKVTHDLLNAQNNTIELGDDFQKASITSTISAVQDTVQSAKEYSQSALQSANGKNTNFYGTNQPLFAVEGDLWYKDLGNGETEMYQYKNGNWELITSTAELHNVQKVVDQAKADMAQAKTDAQNAHDEAIKATNTANGAKAQTTEALEQVKQVQKDLSSVTGTVVEVKKGQNELSAKVADKVDNAVYQTYVTQTDKALSAKLTASDLKGYAKTADVKQTTDGLSASITKVQGDLNGLQIGGANLLDNTAGSWKRVGISEGYTDTVTFNLNKQPQNTTITVSFDCRANISKDFYCFFYGNDYSTNGKVVRTINSQNGVNSDAKSDGRAFITPTTTWKRVWITYELTKIPPVGTKKLLIGRLYSNNYSTSDWLEIRNVKLESGNKATDWCMSDNDVQSQLNTLSGKITATSDRLSSVYTKSETDAKLKTKVEQSILTQTSNNLLASITKNSKILSSIGLKDDTAYINANKIALNGKTLMTSTLMGNAVIDDAFIGSLSADKITTGTLNAANVNIINLDASKITTGTLTAVEMHQTDWLADTWINGEGIHNQMGDYNVWIKRGKLAAFDSRGQGMYMESGQLTLASCAYWQTNLKDEKIDYGVIKCDDDIFGRKGIGVIGKGGFNARTDNCDLSYLNGTIFTGFSGAGIIGDDAGRMMLGGDKAIFIMAGQIYENESILGMQDRPYIRIGGRASNSQAWAEGDDGSSIVINAWDIVLRACGKTNRNIIMNKLTYNGEHTINLNDDTNDLWWGPKMHAPSFVNTSALSKKMNIKKLDVQTAINAIKNTDIYDYQFKEFGETGKHYASLIIDDVNDKPQYKAAGAFVDGLGRDDGTQLGYLTVVVQSLLKEIDILKERIDK